jgi:hypothetical protein
MTSVHVLLPRTLPLTVGRADVCGQAVVDAQVRARGRTTEFVIGLNQPQAEQGLEHAPGIAPTVIVPGNGLQYVLLARRQGGRRQEMPFYVHGLLAVYVEKLLAQYTKGILLH